MQGICFFVLPYGTTRDARTRKPSKNILTTEQRMVKNPLLVVKNPFTTKTNYSSRALHLKTTVRYMFNPYSFINRLRISSDKVTESQMTLNKNSPINRPQVHRLDTYGTLSRSIRAFFWICSSDC